VIQEDISATVIAVRIEELLLEPGFKVFHSFTRSESLVPGCRSSLGASWRLLNLVRIIEELGLRQRNLW
jgi:hypothetical protein